MKKTIRLTESDLISLIKRVLKEQDSSLGTSDNTSVKSPNIVQPKFMEKAYEDSTNLTPQGCSKVRYELNRAQVQSGECFIKNTMKISDLRKNLNLNGVLPFYGDNIDQTIPDAYFKYSDRKIIIFYCDKNNSPIDEKTNINVLLKTYINKRYEIKMYAEEDQPKLEMALQKQFCKRSSSW